jgi:hypothetical protein
VAEIIYNAWNPLSWGGSVTLTNAYDPIIPSPNLLFIGCPNWDDSTLEYVIYSIDLYDTASGYLVDPLGTGTSNCKFLNNILDYANILWPNFSIDSGESWDDGDFFSGDGWNSSWQIEKGWTWNITEEGFNVWNKDSQEIEVTNEAVVTQVAALIGAFASIASSFTSLSTPTGLWQMMNTMQLFTLIILLDLYLPIKVLNSLDWTKYSALAFDVPFIDGIPLLSDIISYLKFSPPQSYYPILGSYSGSSLINIICLFCILLVIWMTHIWFLPWKKIRPSQNSKKILKVICYKVWVFFTFSIYIRMALQSHQHLTFNFISGIYYGQNTNIPRIISIVTSFIIGGLLVFGFAVWVWLLFNERKMGLQEPFIDLKKTLKSRSYQNIAMLRKTVLISWMICFRFTPIYAYLSIPWMCQAVYMGYLVFVRPFLNTKDNLVEVFNESIFTSLLIGLLHLNEEHKWTSFLTNTYVYLLMTPGLFMMLASISKQFEIIF